MSKCKDGRRFNKAPGQHRFQPGQTENPRGRPKGAKSESTVLRATLHRKIEIREKGRVRKVTVLEAIYLRITEDALKGNTKSAAFLLNRYGALVSGELQQTELTDDDQEILKAYARRIEAERTKAEDTP